MNSLETIDEKKKKIKDLKRIFLNYTHFTEKYRIDAIQKNSGNYEREY